MVCASAMVPAGWTSKCREADTWYTDRWHSHWSIHIHLSTYTHQQNNTQPLCATNSFTTQRLSSSIYQEGRTVVWNTGTRPRGGSRTPVRYRLKTLQHCFFHLDTQFAKLSPRKYYENEPKVWLNYSNLIWVVVQKEGATAPDITIQLPFHFLCWRVGVLAYISMFNDMGATMVQT